MLRKTIACCAGLLALGASAPANPVLPGDPSDAPAILRAAEAQLPAAKFARSGKFCRPRPIHFVHDPGGDWAEVTLFERHRCATGVGDDIPYEVYLRRSGGAWAIMCRANFTDVPSYDRVLEGCPSMPIGAYSVFFRH